jgi:hypothetical protein
MSTSCFMTCATKNGARDGAPACRAQPSSAAGEAAEGSGAVQWTSTCFNRALVHTGEGCRQALAPTRVGAGSERGRQAALQRLLELRIREVLHGVHGMQDAVQPLLGAPAVSQW